MEIILDKVNLSHLRDILNNKVLSTSSFYVEVSDIFDTNVDNLNKVINDSSRQLPIFEKIVCGDEESLDRVRVAANNLSSYISSDYKYVYDEMLSCFNVPFFSKGEIQTAKALVEKKQYAEFLFITLKHAIIYYKINLPNAVSKRLFNEAQTLYPFSKTKREMFKTSADLGHAEAAFQYAALVEPEDRFEAFTYYLKSKSTAANWSIAFILEDRKSFGPCLDACFANEDFYSYFIKKVLPFYDWFVGCTKRKFTIDGQMIDSCYNSNSLACAIMIYVYLSFNNDDWFSKSFRNLGPDKTISDIPKMTEEEIIYSHPSFSKALNSLGKWLLSEEVKINGRSAKKIGAKYLEYALQFNNVFAISNYYTFQLKDSNSKYDDYFEMLKYAADIEEPVGTFQFGKILYEQGSDDAYKYLSLSAKKYKNKEAKELCEKIKKAKSKRS